MFDFLYSEAVMSRWSLFFIIVFLAIPQVGIDLYLPSIPSMTLLFHTTATMMQLTLAVYTIGIALSQLISGPISDSLGRKPIIITGLCVFIFGSAICSITHSIDILLLGRLVQGLGIGFGSALSRAILRDLCHDKRIMAKVVSYQSMTWSMVPLLAPIFGGYIEHYLNWRVNFYVLLLMGVMVLLLSIFKFEESKPEQDRSPLHLGNTLRGYITIIRNFSDFSYMLIIALQFGGVLTIIQLSPFIFQDQLGYGASTYGWFIFVVGLGSLMGAFVNRHISQYVSLDKIIFVSIGSAFLIALTMYFLSIAWFNAWVIVIPILLVRFMGGLTYSNCVTQAMQQHPKMSGSVGALFGTVAVGGGSVISSIVAHLPRAQTILSASLSVLLLISFVLFSSVLLYKYVRSDGETPQ